MGWEGKEEGRAEGGSRGKAIRDLRSGKREKARKTRDSSSADRGEAQETRRREIESLPAFHEPKSPADTERIMEEIGEWENLKEAMWRGPTSKSGERVGWADPAEYPHSIALLYVGAHVFGECAQYH